MNHLALFLAIAALVAFLAYQFPYALANNDDKMNLVYLTVIFTVVALGARRLPMNQTIKYAGAWISVFLLIILAYSYKDTFLNTRIMAELLPNHARIDAQGNLTIRASRGGHFFIEAKVNGVPINFMVDTGASDVSISRQDAQRLGIDPDTLNYNRTYMTANGATGGAAIRLKRLQIGPFTLDDFPASVNQGQLTNSLLGMSALRKIGGFRIDGDAMVIGNKD